jgi:hypothetical protein
MGAAGPQCTYVCTKVIEEGITGSSVIDHPCGNPVALVTTMG